TVHGISQDAWDEGDLSELRATVAGALKSRENTVICSHRPVLPDLGRAIAELTGAVVSKHVTNATALPPAGFAVFHITKKTKNPRLVAIESFPIRHHD
ncbi:MAG: NUDIX hydrolase, partial [Microbacteriaceae bacterium]|nr:NUDIX hydrolase [Microbacteriaceae bacterium]